MSVSKVRLYAIGLTAAGVVAAGLLTGVGADLRSGTRLDAAEPAATGAKEPRSSEPGKGVVRVDAPGAEVNVDKERGKVSVTAPYTDVQVDPDKGRVQVRAPYVNLDVRW